MHGRDDANEEVETDAVTGLQPDADCFAADASDPYLTVGLVGEGVVHVVRELTVNADWLQSLALRVGPDDYGAPLSTDHHAGAALRIETAVCEHLSLARSAPWVPQTTASPPHAGVPPDATGYLQAVCADRAAGHPRV